MSVDHRGIYILVPQQCLDGADVVAIFQQVRCEAMPKRMAATRFIDQLYDDNGVALVSFATTAEQLTDLQVAGALNSLVRDGARNEIIAHGPPNTSPTISIGAHYCPID